MLTQNMIPSAPPSYDESQLRHGQGPPQVAVPAPQVQVVREIHYVEAPTFGHSPQVAMCSACGVQVTKMCSSQPMFIILLFTKVTTNTSKSLSLVAWTIIITLCCLQACLCACIPCCMDSCHKVRIVKFLFDCFIGLRKFRSSITAQTANNYWVCTVDLVNPTLTIA